MAFGVPSFIGLHYKVFDLYAPFLALFSFFSTVEIFDRRRNETEDSKRLFNLFWKESGAQGRVGWWEWTKSHIFQEFSQVFFFSTAER